MGRAAAAVGVAAAAAVAGVVALTMKIAEQSDEIAKNSRMMGLTAESYQELSHALELSGSSIGEASSGIRRLSANMLDAQQGLTTAVDAFGELGVEAMTAQGELRGFDSVLADIADEFAAMPDGAEKTARAMELFGRSGAALIPMLNQGSEGIAEMRQEAHELGIVITDEVAKAAEDLNDDITRLKGVARGFAVEVASSLIPRLSVWSDRLVDAALGSRELAETIGDLSGDALDGFASALQSVASLTLGVTQSFLWWKMAYEAISLSANDSGQRVDQFGNSIANSAQQTQQQIAALEELQQQIDNLDFSSTRAEGAGLRGAQSVVAKIEAMTGAMFSDSTVDVDPDPGGHISETARELDKFELAAKASSAALVELRAHQLSVADGMRRIVAEAREAIKVIAEDKSAEEAMLQKQQLIQDQAKALAEASAHVQKETVDMGDKFTQLGKLGASAFGGLVKGFQDLSLAALWKKDGNALKDFGKSLGKMLIQLGTMAIAYAAVAALGAVFPALQPLVGSPAGAPALLAAGAGALAAGAVLGAAIPRGGKGAAPSGGGGGNTRTVETSQTTVYNLTLGAGMSQRGMSRSLLEQVSTAAAQGV
jgi:hypothetical protein